MYFHFIVENDESIYYYFISTPFLRSWCMAQVIWIPNYRSRFNLDQSIAELKMLPLSLNFTDTVPRFFVTHCLIAGQVLSLYNTSYIPKDIQHIIKNCYCYFHALWILFLIFNYVSLSKDKQVFFLFLYSHRASILACNVNSILLLLLFLGIVLWSLTYYVPYTHSKKVPVTCVFRI